MYVHSMQCGQIDVWITMVFYYSHTKSLILISKAICFLELDVVEPVAVVVEGEKVMPAHRVWGEEIRRAVAQRPAVLVALEEVEEGTTTLVRLVEGEVLNLPLVALVLMV